jgi:hypothetical protein
MDVVRSHPALFDHLTPLARSARRRELRSPALRSVADDWPPSVPIAPCELDMWEFHFANILDRVLGDG